MTATTRIERIAYPADGSPVIPSRATAMQCADLVELAYHQDARPMVTPIDDGIVLAFAGSRSVDDWRIDSESWHVREAWASDAGVHKGFAGLADHVWDAAADAAAKARKQHTCPRIVVTGHSLGAALALITAYRLSGTRCAPDRLAAQLVEVVAFGCPRVGDTRWHADYRRAAIPTLRVYCAHDPIAHLPGLWGWRHVGDALHVDEDGTPLRDPSSFIEAARYWLGWKLGHLDHSMTGYRIALAAHEHRGFQWPA